MKKVLGLVLSLMLLAVFSVGCKPAETPKPEATKEAPATPAPEKPAEAPAPAPAPQQPAGK